MLFFGTGAAELYPNPFCNCEFCESLRKTGEAPRKRSCLLMDAHNMIDFGPEALAAAQMYGARLYDVDNLFITHSHEDHFCFSNIEVLSMTPQRDDKPLNIYLSESACDFVQRYLAALRAVYARGETELEVLIKKGRWCCTRSSPTRTLRWATWTCSPSRATTWRTAKTSTRSTMCSPRRTAAG